MRWTLALLVLMLGTAVWAQDEMPNTVIRTNVDQVSVPVTVQTKNGTFVNGLEQKDFSLYDNDKLQDIKVDVDFSPISLVVCFQKNANSSAFLPYIKQMGNMLEALLIGDQGEAAIVAFDHRMQLIQDWTNDGAQMKEALSKVTPYGSRNTAVVDAVFYATRMLRTRPPGRRRVLLLISETRDSGSEGKLRDALTEIELQNVSVYTVNINAAKAMLTAPAEAPRPSPYPTAARSIPGSLPQTPQIAAQLSGQYSIDFKPVIKEIFTQVKGLFIDNYAEVLTRYTGGREYGFTGLSDLEHAISDIGTELHSQYLITYRPNNTNEGGFHTIRVQVDRPVVVDHREGYWMAARPDSMQ